MNDARWRIAVDTGGTLTGCWRFLSSPTRAQPGLGQIAESVIRCDLRRREMAVVVEDGLIGRVLMVEIARRVGVEEKIG